MPVVNVERRQLFEALGRSFTTKEFEDLCFEFGIELDEVTTQAVMEKKNQGLAVTEADYVDTPEDPIIYKIEIPANRYDLLCLEGIAKALNVFSGKFPSAPSLVGTPAVEEMRVDPSTATIRPFAVAAILRNITFTEASYKRFIDLQDKLHMNICRKRTLVAIGTHDLDTLQGPFSYEALPPQDIVFTPLNRDREMSAVEIMEEFEHDLKLKHFLHIIRDSPVYPVIYDANRTVLSMPPIINGDHSKISTNTKNVFIECTATDLTKAKIVLNMIVDSFSEHCSPAFEVEYVKVINPNVPEHSEGVLFPDFTIHEFAVEMADIQRITGISLSVEQACTLLRRMMLDAAPSSEHPDTQLRVLVPPSRSDILHACDIIEDVAIAYGFNNIPRIPPQTVSVGATQPINKLTDLLRQEIAMSGFMEILTFSLCSPADNYENLLLPADGTALEVTGKLIESQSFRTRLIPGMLKTIAHNRDTPMPLKLFEVSDVVVVDPSVETGARNHRKVILAHVGTTSNLTMIHGMVDRLMVCLGEVDYRVEQQPEETREPFFLPERAMSVVFKGATVGSFGIIHPHVLRNFEIVYPVSLLEISLAPFL